MKSFFSLSIRTHLLILVALAILPALGIILYSGIKNHSHALRDAKLRVMQLEQTMAENQLRTLAGTRQLLMTLAKLPMVKNKKSPNCSRLLRDLLTQNPCLSNIYVADRHGTIFASAFPTNGMTIAGHDYFRNAVSTRGFSSGDYMVSPKKNKPVIHYAYPSLGEDGSVTAVIVAVFDLEYYGNVFAQANLPSGSALALTDTKGTRIYRLPDSSKYFGIPDLPRMVKRMSGSSREGTFVAEGVDGITRLYGFRQLQIEPQAAPLFIRVGIPEDTVLAAAQSDFLLSLALMGGATLLALLFAWFLGDIFFMRRLTRLIATSNMIGNGNLEARTGIQPGEGEIGRLAGSLDEMACALQSRDQERSRAEEALMESEKRLSLVLQGSNDGFWDWNMKSREVQHSNRWAEMLGYSPEEIEHHVRSWKSLVHPEDMPAVVQVFKEHLNGHRSQYRIEYRMRCKTGEWKWILDRGRVVEWDDNGMPLRMSGTATDITERKQAEEEKRILESQLLQAQKMEAVGQLAGGIAHDFNNILTAIVGYGNLLLMKITDNKTLRQYNEHILSAANRGAALTRSLLAFSRKQIMNPQPVRLHEILSHVEKLLRRLIGEDIELSTDLTTEDPVIMADSGQIEQILMNLATNARDAMPDGGTIRIRTELIEVNEESKPIPGLAHPGSYAVLSFSDTGCGMDDVMQDKIFEPFFTTKEVGKGTGLGLAMVYGIIQQHSGHIAVTSKPGAGTTFTIYLPIHRGSVKQNSETESAFIGRGTETILVAEDDEVIRTLVKQLLEENGYNVIMAADGEDAVRKYLDHRENIRLLILDLILPKRNGKDTYLLIKEMDPCIRALFISGYTADILKQKGLWEGRTDFLEKPIRPDVLLRRIREILDGTPPSA